MKILFLDTWYPEVLNVVMANREFYETRLTDLLRLHFGTSYYYSVAFRDNGWEAVDLIANDSIGRQLWAREHGRPWSSNLQSVVDQIELEKPDLVYCQDLTFLPRSTIEMLRNKGGIHFVAQHSSPWAGDERVAGFELVFTSFPHYIERIRAVGVRAGFLEIGFGSQILNKVSIPDRKEHEVVFVGGVNASSGHWRKGTDVLVHLARMLGKKHFAWWGYVIGNDADLHPALRETFKGQAWGLEMYRVYASAKIVVNRHGEVADVYANNMRLFEATGMGACLMTEQREWLEQYFIPQVECVTYASQTEALEKARLLLNADSWRARIAKKGHLRTLSEHTYTDRLFEIQSKLREMIS